MALSRLQHSPRGTSATEGQRAESVLIALAGSPACGSEPSDPSVWAPLRALCCLAVFALPLTGRNAT